MASGCSAVFLLDGKGKLLIARNFRGDIPMSAAERFVQRLLEEEDDSNAKPVVEQDGTTFCYTKENSVYFVATTNNNANAAMILSFLYRIIEVFRDYLKVVEEETVRDNFVIIYELLDEMMDLGFPQTTEAKVLQEFITQEGHKSEKELRPPPALTNAVSWRSEGVKYRKNQIFVDVIESVNLLANANGSVLRSEVVGTIKMKAELTGMPELRLGLNDRVTFGNSSGGESSETSARGRGIEMEDVTFHQCVRLARFESDKTISFIPPDGEFEMMSYRLSTQLKPLIWCEVVVDRHQHSRIEYLVKVRSHYKEKSTANNVQILIPVPPDVDSPKFKATIGKVAYSPQRDCIVWSIKQFQGNREFLMRAHFGLPSITEEEGPDKRRPVSIKFEIPYFTVSGIQIRYLKIIEKSGYQALPWVRYITNSGDYQIRI